MFSRIKTLFRLLFPIFFASQLTQTLKPFSEGMPVSRGSVYFPNGRFIFNGKSNGASRKKKTNRLHLSKKTRNKHRKNK